MGDIGFLSSFYIGWHQEYSRIIKLKVRIGHEHMRLASWTVTIEHVSVYFDAACSSMSVYQNSIQRQI